MYYPKSQITTNLYTGGDELMIASNKSPYTGPYYKLSNGKKFVGEVPTGSPIELVEIEFLDSEVAGDELSNTIHIVNYEDESIIENFNYEDTINLAVYNELRKNNLSSNRELPQPITFNDKAPFIGEEIQRYFAKRNNQQIYTEISLETYKKFKFSDPKVAFELYNVLSIPFSLGDNADIVNRKIIDNVEKNYNWIGFHHFFRGKFSIGDSNSESFFTRGGEFVLPNRTNYIGFYHFMPDGTAMTGKNHGDGAEIILISLNNKNITESDDSISSNEIVSTPVSSPAALSGGGAGSGGGGGY